MLMLASMPKIVVNQYATDKPKSLNDSISRVYPERCTKRPIKDKPISTIMDIIWKTTCFFLLIIMLLLQKPRKK